MNQEGVRQTQRRQRYVLKLLTTNDKSSLSTSHVLFLSPRLFSKTWCALHAESIYIYIYQCCSRHSGIVRKKNRAGSMACGGRFVLFQIRWCSTQLIIFNRLSCRMLFITIESSLKCIEAASTVRAKMNFSLTKQPFYGVLRFYHKLSLRCELEASTRDTEKEAASAWIWQKTDHPHLSDLPLYLLFDYSVDPTPRWGGRPCE